MTSALITVSPDATSESTPTSLHLTSDATAFFGGSTGRLATPFFVPSHQAYYWTLAWQRDEADALREIADGNVRTFGSGADAAEWLLADDDT